MSTSPLAPAVLGASTVTTIGAVIAVLVGVGAIVFLIANLRSARPEVGSEIELAPNRKPYLTDEELETTRLNRTLRWALALLVVCAVGLPLYWLNEPSRMSGAIEEYERIFAGRGEEQYVEGSACQDCHGPEASGGVAPYTITDADNNFVATVQWRAPALDTVLLRFSREEVEYIINYGRPYSPMVGWGAAVNKGPLNEQQITNLVDYLESIQKTPDETQQEITAEVAVQLGLIDDAERSDPEAVAAAEEQIDWEDPRVGEILFNNEIASGAYSCARCHTRGWSIIDSPDQIEPSDADLSDYIGFPDGSGALGPNLTGAIVPGDFASIDQLAEFIGLGSTEGEAYGQTNIGSGMMPGFGDNPNTEEVEGDGMMTPEMLRAIAGYVEGLTPAETTTNTPPEGGEAADGAAAGGEAASATDGEAAGEAEGGEAAGEAEGGEAPGEAPGDDEPAGTSTTTAPDEEP